MCACLQSGTYQMSRISNWLGKIVTITKKYFCKYDTQHKSQTISRKYLNFKSWNTSFSTLVAVSFFMHTFLRFPWLEVVWLKGKRYLFYLFYFVSTHYCHMRRGGYGEREVGHLKTVPLWCWCSAGYCCASLAVMEDAYSIPIMFTDFGTSIKPVANLLF